jgi:predicted CoA-binding protein
MNAVTLDARVQDFLAQKRIAVAGVSRNNSHHPVGNLIYHRLKTTGHDVFPVNPHMQTFEGDRCYPDLRSIPDGVDAVVVITRPETTERIVHDCSDTGSDASGCTNRCGRDPASRRLRWSTAINTTSASSLVRVR